MADTGDASLEPADLEEATPPTNAALETARTLTEHIDDAMRRLYDFHASGDLDSAHVVSTQLAGFQAQLKALIG